MSGNARLEDTQKPSLLSTQNTYGAKELKEKIQATRKAITKKYKSVYFGSLTDEDLGFAAKHSNDPEVLAILFRSKSEKIRSALAENGKESAYETSLALLNDKLVSIRALVLENAWLQEADFELLFERQGLPRFLRNGDTIIDAQNCHNHLRILNKEFRYIGDSQMYLLARNYNVKDTFIERINAKETARELAALNPRITKLLNGDRAFISKNARRSEVSRRKPTKLGNAEVERLTEIEQQLLGLNVVSRPTPSQKDDLETKVLSKSPEQKRVGVSKKKDEQLASSEGLTVDEFRYLVFGSRDMKIRNKAITNSEFPGELFDELLQKYPEEATNSPYFWIRYLEDPQLLGSPDLKQVKKLLTNPDVPASFITETYHRSRGGTAADRLWRDWRTTLLAIARHPNTPLEVLNALLEWRGKRAELKEAILNHPRMQDTTFNG